MTALSALSKKQSDTSSNMGVSARLKDNYDSYYDGESEWRALGAIGKAKNIVDLCNSIPHRKILDIGSGEGAVLQRISDVNFGEELYSVEVSQSAITAILQRNIPHLRDCRRFDGYNLPQESPHVDLAILSHVLEHVEYPRKLLYEAARVADYVFVEVPLEDTAGLKTDFVFDKVGHINFYSWKTIRQLIQSCELRILSQVIVNPSRAVYEYQSGRKGTLKYAIKGLSLWASKRLACELFTYNSALICTKNS